jgi:uncharacterized membrane protein YdbT with pleckstrin-like domain
MGFPARYLNEGEAVVADMRPHWLFLAGPVASVAASVAAAFAAALVFTGASRRVLLSLALVVVLLTLLWLGVRYARWATTSFVITTDRLIHRVGVLSKSGREIPLERLNDVSFHQTLFQRLVGAGDLLVESAGERGQQSFSGFPRPERTQNVIHREIQLAQTRDLRDFSALGSSPLDQLDRLDDLRRRGVISEAEFEAKKVKLLDRL